MLGWKQDILVGVDWTVLCALGGGLRSRELLSQVVRLLEQCWQQNPSDRPSMAAVAEQLHIIVETAKSRARVEQRDADFARRTWTRG